MFNLLDDFLEKYSKYQKTRSVFLIAFLLLSISWLMSIGWIDKIIIFCAITAATFWTLMNMKRPASGANLFIVLLEILSSIFGAITFVSLQPFSETWSTLANILFYLFFFGIVFFVSITTPKELR